MGKRGNISKLGELTKSQKVAKILGVRINSGFLKNRGMARLVHRNFQK